LFVSYHILEICKAPLRELAIQRRFQHDSREKIRMSSDNERKRWLSS